MPSSFLFQSEAETKMAQKLLRSADETTAALTKTTAADSLLLETQTNANNDTRTPQEILSQHFTFPCVLFRMLLEAETNGFQHVVSWQPHGRAFKVHDRSLFVKQLLPTYFQQSKWGSFQRQLNMYNFKRMWKGPDKEAYYNPLFVKQDAALCLIIKRIVRKGTGPRQPAPDDEPNFYAVVESAQQIEPCLKESNPLFEPILLQPQHYQPPPFPRNMPGICTLNWASALPASIMSYPYPDDGNVRQVSSNQQGKEQKQEQGFATAVFSLSSTNPTPNNVPINGDHEPHEFNVDDDDTVCTLNEYSTTMAIFSNTATTSRKMSNSMDLLANPFEEGFEW